jgi:hypothetical protein
VPPANILTESSLYLLPKVWWKFATQICLRNLLCILLLAYLPLTIHNWWSWWGVITNEWYSLQKHDNHEKDTRTHGQVINQTTGKTSMQFTTLNSEVLRKNKRSKKMSSNDRPWHWPHPTQLPTPLYTHKILQVNSQGNAEKTLWQAWTRDCNQLGYPIYQKAQRLLTH